MSTAITKNSRYRPYRFRYQRIDTHSALLAPRTGGIGAKTLELPGSVYEHPDEKWADDSVHRYYKVPTLVIHANPSVTIHCEVQRDKSVLRPTSLSVNRWVNAEYFIWEMSAKLADSLTNPVWTQFFNEHHQAEWQCIKELFQKIGDLPERFVQEVPTPPYFVADVSIRMDQGSFYFPLCAQSGREMIDSRFWAFWLFVLRQEAETVGTFNVVLRVPHLSPPNESPIDLYSEFFARMY